MESVVRHHLKVGYNFVWNKRPKPAADARDAYEECLYAGGPTPEVRERYFDAIGPYSFQLNLAGMGYCRVQMEDFGMVYDAEQKPFPDWPESLNRASSAEAALEWRRANREEYDRVLHQEREAMRQGDRTRPGIPRFKFMSNGPWIVTESEVRSAVALYDDVDPVDRLRAEQEETWAAWIGYLRESVLHGGFEVG